MRRLFPFMLAILAVVALLVGGVVLLQVDGRRNQIASALSQRLRHEVTLGKVEAGLFPPTLKLKAFSVLRADKSPFLQSDQVDAVLDGSSLLRFKVVPNVVTLRRWNLTVRRRPDASWDLDEWNTVSDSLAPGTAWPLRTISLKEGECHWVDPQGTPSGRELVAQSIDGDWDLAGQKIRATGTLNSRTPLAFTLEGKGQFVGVRSWSGEVRFADEGRSWIVQLAEKDNLVDAKGTAKEWRVGPVLDLARFYLRQSESTAPQNTMLSDWQTHLTWHGAMLTLYHAGKLAGGATEIKGTVTSGNEGLRLQLKGGADGVPVSVFDSGADALLTKGTFKALVTDFDMTYSTRSWGSLHAKGAIEINGGSYRLPEPSVKSLTKAKTMAYLRDKYPGFTEQGFPFTKVTLHPEVKDGVVTLSDLHLVGDGLEAALVGKINLVQNGCDAILRLQLQEKDRKRIRLIPGKYLYGPAGHEKIQPMYGRLQGTWKEWTLRALPSSKVPTAVQSKLRTALKS